MNETTEIMPTATQATFLRIAMQALAVKVARWVTLLLSFVLFGAAVWYPDWKRLAAAACFTLLVHCPLWLRKEAPHA